MYATVPYTVPGYPTGTNPATGGPWAPATDALRNLTEKVNRDGTVTVWASTSTGNGNADPGADPNRLVKVSDRLNSAAAGPDQFTTVRQARFGEVLRGVSFTRPRYTIGSGHGPGAPRLLRVGPVEPGACSCRRYRPVRADCRGD